MHHCTLLSFAEHSDSVVKERIRELVTKCPNGLFSSSIPDQYRKTYNEEPPSMLLKCTLSKLRYDLIDRPGVLGNYVPVNYHSLYDLSVLVEGF